MKKSGIKHCFFVLTALVLSLFFAMSNQAGAAKSKSKENPKYASLVMDADTGAILFQKNADARRHPASLTKVMTLLLVFDALHEGRLDLDDRIMISRRAAAASPSKIGLPAGASIKVKDAIHAIITKSANDISIAVAEHLGRTESNFARKMTARARSIGMASTVFKNASGLHNPDQITTARDMAKMARYVINTYPSEYRYFSKTNFSFRGRSYHNHNRLMSTYKGMDGMKTGFINASGFNLISSAVRGNTRLIGVVFGGRSANSRNEHMANLLDKGFADLKGKPSELLIANLERIENTPGMEANRRTKTVPVPATKPSALLAEVDAIPQTEPQADTQIASVVLQRKSDSPFKTLLTETDRMAIPAQIELTQPAISTVVLAEPLKSPSVNAIQKPAAPVISEEDNFDELTGQGDFDIDISERIETGMIAVSAMKNATPKQKTAHKKPQIETKKVKVERSQTLTPNQGILKSAFLTRRENSRAQVGHMQTGWAIQVGAFNSRTATDQAIYNARKKLPPTYAGASPLIAPLKTGDSWLFRARLGGLTKAQAMDACKRLSSCLPIAPSE